MEDIRKILLEKCAIFADASGENLSCALVKNSRVISEVKMRGSALENLFELVKKALMESKTELSEISLFAFCIGPGSILGIRANSAAFSVFRAASEGSLLATWKMLDCYAQILKSKGLNEFSIVCASRKNYANALISCDDNMSAKEIETSKIAELQKPVFYIAQRKNSDPNFANLEEVYFSASQIFELLKSQPELLSVCKPYETPDALTLAKREYVKWNSHAQV